LGKEGRKDTKQDQKDKGAREEKQEGRT